MFDYVFYNSWTNKINMFLLMYFIIFLRNKIIFNSRTRFLLSIGLYLSFSTLMSFVLSTDFKIENIFQQFFSSFFVIVIYPLCLYSSIKNLRQVILLLKLLSIFIFIEVGLIGTLYFYFPTNQIFIQVIDILNKEIFLDPIFQRLTSFSTNSPIDSSLLLCVSMAFMLYFYQQFNKKIFLLLFIISIFPLILTFSRSGWMMFILIIIGISFYNFRSKIQISILIGVMTSIVLYFLKGTIVERFFYDDRLTNNPASLRLQMMGEYLSKSLNTGFFGMNEDIEQVKRSLDLSSAMSSENTFIQVFLTNGFLAGVLFSSVTFFFCYKIFRLYMKSKINSLLQEFRFLNYSIIWILIGLIFISNTFYFPFYRFIWWFIFSLILILENLSLKISNEKHDY